jgi:hypothetical protein
LRNWEGICAAAVSDFFRPDRSRGGLFSESRTIRDTLYLSGSRHSPMDSPERPRPRDAHPCRLLRARAQGSGGVIGAVDKLGCGSLKRDPHGSQALAHLVPTFKKLKRQKIVGESCKNAYRLQAFLEK